VPIAVDKDRRPDIDARYSKGGWPTLAYLDDQGELIASDSFLDVDELIARLDLVSGYWADNRERIRRRLAEAADRRPQDQARPARGELTSEILDNVARTLQATADPVHGGWGAQHKFPHAEAIDFALIRWSQTGDEALRKLVLRTLRNMQAGEIHDRVEGGFFRYATSPDWGGPHPEKVLDSNAQRLYSYLEAYQALGDESFRETALGILRWMNSTLLDRETGAYRGSQDADPEYARLLTLEGRRVHGVPACDPTLFANWNAMAASALFKASAVLDQPEAPRAGPAHGRVHRRRDVRRASRRLPLLGRHLPLARHPQRSGLRAARVDRRDAVQRARALPRGGAQDRGPRARDSEEQRRRLLGTRATIRPRAARSGGAIARCSRTR
jgi:uncharacterized protein YyaL (SSP411 family)